MFKKHVKSVGIYKPNETASFEIGAKLKFGELETDNTVDEITVDIFKTVVVKFSNEMTLVFKGFPISFEI